LATTKVKVKKIDNKKNKKAYNPELGIPIPKKKHTGVIRKTTITKSLDTPSTNK
jgi:hypothetical protein